MQRLVWATDVHLEFADASTRSIFAKSIVNQQADALLLTGDIANFKLIERLLVELQKQIGIPIYFNMGNHDFYGGSIARGRSWAMDVSEYAPKLLWIEGAGVVELNSNVCLVGVDGWGDGRLGNYKGSNVLLNDWELIDEFADIDAIRNRGERVKLLNQLGYRAAKRIRSTLERALPKYSRVLLMTHVPPWKEATWHEGAHSDNDWLPWFSCKGVGEAIVDMAAQFPDSKVTVLCGHTHGNGFSQINEQIEAHTGGAQYRSPAVQCSFDVSSGQIVRVGSNTWFSTGY